MLREMYLSRHLFQNVYKWNRPSKKRYNGNVAAKLGYLIHLQEPYIKLHYTVTAMNWASMNGEMKVVKWLHENRTEGCTPDAMNSAAERGNLDMVRWLYYNRKECSVEDAIESALKYGKTKVAEWLKELKR